MPLCGSVAAGQLACAVVIDDCRSMSAPAPSLGDAGCAGGVSSERLPKLIDQITKTNFMTVTNVTLEKADPWQDLERGFFYGNEPIVRATLTIETIWFRSWMVPMMPTDLRYLMAVVAKEGEGTASGEAQPTTPAEGEGEAGSSRGRRDNR